jgi:hypothetical protein
MWREKPGGQTGSGGGRNLAFLVGTVAENADQYEPLLSIGTSVAMPLSRQRWRWPVLMAYSARITFLCVSGIWSRENMNTSSVVGQQTRAIAQRAEGPDHQSNR